MTPAPFHGRARAFVRVAALLIAGAVTGRAAGAQATAQSAAAAPPAGAPATAGATGSIRGIIVDSLTSAGGLAGAEVYLGESGMTATTDGAGRFALEGLAPGRYTVAFSHPTLDSLGIGTRPVAVTVTAGMAQQLLLSTPSARTVAHALCPALVGDSTGALVGAVRNAETGAPIANARVLLSWTNLVLGPSGAVKAPKTILATTDRSGVYRACGVPTSSAVAVRATAPAEMGVTDVASGAGIVTLAGGLGLRNLVVAVTPAGRVGGTTRAGGATLAVTVSRNDGTPIPGAQVSVAGDSMLAVSDASGRARLANAPIGTRAVEIRALGYAPQLVAVDLRANQQATAAVRLEKAAQVLDTVRVVGLRNDRWTATGFEQRKLLGQGYYLDRADIERRSALRFTDLLRYVPGVQIAPSTQGTSNLLAMRGNTLAGCAPSVYVDGIGFSQSGSTTFGAKTDLTTLSGQGSDQNSAVAGLGVDDFLVPSQVEAIEVYPSSAGVPAQYLGGSCGTILVWTRSSRPSGSR